MKIQYGLILVNNQFLTPEQTKQQPIISDIIPANGTLIMYDPDAVHGTYIHWIYTNGMNILPYIGPSPPKETGIHRYIFEFYSSQPNNVTKQTSIERNLDISNLLIILNISASSLVDTKQFQSSFSFQNSPSYGGCWWKWTFTKEKKIKKSKRYHTSIKKRRKNKTFNKRLRK